MKRLEQDMPFLTQARAADAAVHAARHNSAQHSVRAQFHSYAHASSALCLTGAFGTALGFALVSAIRHLLWFHMAGGRGWGIPLWIETAVITAVMLAFWYRIVVALLRQRRQRRQFIAQLEPRLKVLKINVPNAIRDVATWHELDDNRCAAFTWGLFRPRIALSSGLCKILSEPAHQAVMFHEAAHARVYDPLQQLLLAVLADAFGPFGMRALYNRYLIQREIAADQVALAACGGDDIPLLSALMAVARGQNRQETAGGYAGLDGVMEARLSFLETGSAPRVGSGLVHYRLLASLSAIALTIAQGLLVWCH